MVKDSKTYASADEAVLKTCFSCHKAIKARDLVLTNTAVSSSRLYWENKFSFVDAKNVNIPVAVSVFPDEIYTVSRSWAAKAYPKLIHYNRLEKGGHFAAWEQPELFAEEIRVAFKTLR